MNTSFVPEGRLTREFPKYRGKAIKSMIANRAIISAYVNSVSEDGEVQIKIGKNVDGFIKCEQFIDSVGTVKKDGHSAKHMLGKMISVVIIDIKSKDTDKYYVEASRKKAQHICRSIHLSRLRCGDIIDASILSASDNGIFCDIGCGIVSIMAIKDFGVSKMLCPKYQLKGIRNIRVVVKQISDSNIYVSHKELLGTWEENASQLSIGETIKGQVIQSNEKGIFVRVKDNLYGLADANEKVQVGSIVEVRVINVVPNKMKLKLELVQELLEEYEREPIKYMVKPGLNRIEYWRYSPESCDRVIETVFNNEKGVDKVE